MQKTLYLDTTNWDIHVDSSGNLQTIAGKYATAQGVANEVQLFTNDAYFAKDEGVPHFVTDLGINPPMSLARSRLRKAALRAPDVVDARVYLDGIDTKTRLLTGTIEVVGTDNSRVSVSL